ncbi:hypothetical protein D1871_14350 [Nakamurella silvestris]|nr:hypothetical protein D1871_14350 [Nakamurella silvestris]
MRTVSATLAVCLTGAVLTVAALSLPGRSPTGSHLTDDQTAVASQLSAAGSISAGTDTAHGAEGSRIRPSTAPDGGPLLGGSTADGTVPAADTPPGTSSPTGPSAAAPAEIVISDFTFSVLTVPAGTVVTVRNNDSMPHSATESGGLFDTGIIPAGGQAEFAAPAVAGSYTFTCTIHPTMSGVLTVI